MKETYPIIIVGAGISGLMAARELAKTGHRSLILEARDRIGGRIWPLSAAEFGYAAEGGAEFVHGEAKITRALMNEAGLTYIPTDGDMWRVERNELVPGWAQEPPQPKLFAAKLKDLKEDIPIAEFLARYFGGAEYAELRDAIFKRVSGYDAADPKRASTFAFRDEWLSQNESWQQGRIKEGYGALVDFLGSEVKKAGCEIWLNCEVRMIERHDGLSVYCGNTGIHKNGVSVYWGKTRIYKTEKILLSVPMPLIRHIKFNPEIPDKFEAAGKIGFGAVVKILIRFREPWWKNARGKDLNRMMFVFSDEAIPTWWTQFPEPHPVLTGWLGGPDAEKFVNTSPEDTLDAGFNALVSIFRIPKSQLRGMSVRSAVTNWLADPFALGAYSYATVEMEQARRELARPVDNSIFFVGEALYEGNEASTVEGALASACEVAKKVAG